jgi:hypothetical protein
MEIIRFFGLGLKKYSSRDTILLKTQIWGYCINRGIFGWWIPVRVLKLLQHNLTKRSIWKFHKTDLFHIFKIFAHKKSPLQFFTSLWLLIIIQFIIFLLQKRRFVWTPLSFWEVPVHTILRHEIDPFRDAFVCSSFSRLLGDVFTSFPGHQAQFPYNSLSKIQMFRTYRLL